MSVRTSPCDWPVSYASCIVNDSGYPEPLASLPPSGIQQVEDVATEYLWRWTGQMYGLCEVTINPCRNDCSEFRNSFFGSGGPFPRFFQWGPVLVSGMWFNIGCRTCGDKCRCGGGAPLTIPGPIDSISQILEDGVPLDPNNYHVENNSAVVRTDGKIWSACGLEITYTRGTPVPVGGQVAAGILALEFAKAMCNDGTCQLPTRVQTITRQGVTIAMLDSFDDIDKGHTGIWTVDSWISSIMKPPIQSRVLSPDVARRSPRRRTWP